MTLKLLFLVSFALVSVLNQARFEEDNCWMVKFKVFNSRCLMGFVLKNRFLLETSSLKNI